MLKFSGYSGLYQVLIGWLTEILLYKTNEVDNLADKLEPFNSLGKSYLGERQ